MANYSQRYSSAQTNTAGAFKFDTITSVDWPVAKLIWGDEGTATYASASNPLPVTISGVATAANQSTANGLLTTIDADTGAIATAAASLDSKTPALGQALAAASVPVVLTAAQLSTLTPPAAITGFATAANQLPDGHNVTVSGSVTANIGTVGTLATAAKQDTGNTSLATLAGAVSGTEVQVDIVTMPAVTISGTVTVGSHAVTNAGTFAVQVDGAALTSLQLLDDSVATVGSAITSKGMAAVGTDGTNARILKTDASGELQVDVLTMPSVAVTNAGTFVVQENGAALTALQLIDDAVYTHNTSPPSKVIAIGAYDDDDSGNVKCLRCNSDGILYTSIGGVANPIPVSSSPDGQSYYQDGSNVGAPLRAVISASSSGNNTLVAAGGGSFKIRVLAYNIMASGAVNAKFQSGAGGTDLTGLKYFAAAGGGIVAPYNPYGWFETAANTLLNLNLSGAVAVGGEITYVKVT